VETNKGKYGVQVWGILKKKLKKLKNDMKKWNKVQYENMQSEIKKLEENMNALNIKDNNGEKYASHNNVICLFIENINGTI